MALPSLLYGRIRFEKDPRNNRKAWPKEAASHSPPPAREELVPGRSPGHERILGVEEKSPENASSGQISFSLTPQICV